MVSKNITIISGLSTWVFIFEPADENIVAIKECNSLSGWIVTESSKDSILLTIDVK